MASGESLRPHTDRLAGLLADARGTEILDELQLIASLSQPAPILAEYASCQPQAAPGQIGVWRIEQGPDGTALRRIPNRGDLSWWADVEHIPLRTGARRLVLIGESIARGWLYDPDFNPAMALDRQLAAAEPDGYQIIDLARAGICTEELTELVGQLPPLAPDCVIVIAGNNWVTVPFAPGVELFDAMAQALRTGGYAALRSLFLDTVVLPRVREFLDSLAALHAEHGTQVIVVVPEFNLQGWAPPPDVEVPVLATGALDKWYELRDQALQAGRDGRWADVGPITQQMRAIDEGLSPVPGALLAAAATALGDGKSARLGFEQSRDALVGVSVVVNSQITTRIQELLTTFAAEHGFRCVDLRTVLAADGDLWPPEPGSFLDYCHLSDEAIEQAMGAVADTVLGLPAGTTRPGPGAAGPVRARARVVAAAQSAYVGQPAEVVRRQLRAALDADPQVTGLMAALLDVLEGAGPAWTHAGLQALAVVKSAREIFGPMLLASIRSDRMWTLRACLGEILERTPPAAGADVNLMITADKMDRQRPDCTPRRSYWRLTAERSALAFALDRPRAGTLRLTYRMPAGPPGSVASITVNDVPAGTVPTATRWANAEIELPAGATHPGVNWIHLHWPVPTIDAEDWYRTEAATLVRRGFPVVAPIFGELFEARLALQEVSHGG